MDSDRCDANNRNRLSWWFSKLRMHMPQLNTPDTRIVYHDGGPLIDRLDGEMVRGFGDLCSRIHLACKSVGYPAFLRTDYLSGKHGWGRTCFLEKSQDIPGHIDGIVEASVMADMTGFPTDYWAVRRLIPTKPAFTAFCGQMPIVKERRYFVQDGHVICHHPYWPPDVLRKTRTSVGNWEELLAELNEETEDETDYLSCQSGLAGLALGGAWSIDWLWSEPLQKWFLIDAAEADSSWHWPNCKNDVWSDRQ